MITERLGVITSNLEAARKNDGLTAKLIEWAEMELTKAQVGLIGITYSIERIRKRQAKNGEDI